MKKLIMRGAMHGAKEARKILDLHFSTFRGLIEQTKTLSGGKDANSTAAFAQIAADYAWKNPPGQLASPELEQMATELARKFMPAGPNTDRNSSQGLPKRILHVLTAAYPLGGHTRFVWRWIQQDVERTHSIALTG